MKNSAHILVVDDHREIRDLLAKLLRKHGYRVSVASDGREMRRRLQEAGIDLIVLDLMLPVEDGLSLCRDLRAGRSSIPIIMLTAKGDEVDRVVGLEMGADDYIAKPFSGRELIARIKAVLRRTQPLSRPQTAAVPSTYRFGKWALNTAKREVESEDNLVVPLSSGEYNLLLAFLRNPQRVLSRNQIIDITRGGNATPTDRCVDLQVSRLRRKIESDPRKPDLIKTAWGDGYVFVQEVENA